MSPRRTAASGLFGVACLLAAASAGAAVTTVYKCFDSKLGVLYTDQPCRGEALAIEAGSIDPVAVAELQREREALSRAMAQRFADSRRPAIDRDYAPSYYAGPPMDGGYGGYGGEAYYPAYSPVPYVNDRRLRPDNARPPVRRDRTPPSVPASRGNLIKR